MDEKENERFDELWKQALEIGRLMIETRTDSRGDFVHVTCTTIDSVHVVCTAATVPNALRAIIGTAAGRLWRLEQFSLGGWVPYGEGELFANALAARNRLATANAHFRGMITLRARQIGTGEVLE